MQRRSNAYHISVLAVLMAIVIIQNIVPFFGYIPLPGLSYYDNSRDGYPGRSGLGTA